MKQLEKFVKIRLQHIATPEYSYKVKTQTFKFSFYANEDMLLVHLNPLINIDAKLLNVKFNIIKGVITSTH
jgi:hypothetical protein